ncbi:cobalt ABC transporter, inner membrane subunit CbiQ [Kribbella flavida DSM 17836]|uniref:Cobalt ABC transporter, inner membrane subunit CbiQ n=1 Tax=Kribbella flavida (strain DSM 17836 / JCM 10339 / NBRC 14399) TaxID=479435 RepID=D2PMS3_KRIFD|nr:cobalt ECF transporter T component CbiQ [Kribbella flavida]ADB32625.1 cobalt ABC transporter, inner membrane subunit CbiQ [Kribbella flavida DSM 17836]
MSAAAGDGLLVLTGSRIHRLPAQVKIVALLLFVLAVVSTPAAVFWAFALYAVLLAGCVAIAKLPLTTVLRRLAVETPFIVFALLLPFVATGPSVEVLGVSLSQSGVLGAWNVLAKGTLGVLAAIVLSATTSPRDLLAGLERLRLPPTLVAILSFMVRYLGVVSDDLHRMRIARESRGYAGGRAGQLTAVAGGVGALFVRSFERGERVHLAMQSRGYTGRMPQLAVGGAGRAQWLEGLAMSLAAVAVAVAARVVGL